VPETYISIGQVKRDISDLVNRVAYRGERIVLTSRGKPKAVLVSVADYKHLEQETGESLARWQVWLAESDRLNADILERRCGVPLDVDRLWEEVQLDREARDEQILGR
jgi:prevent-host-death family protein